MEIASSRRRRCASGLLHVISCPFGPQLAHRYEPPIDASRTAIHVGFALPRLSRLVSFCQNLSRRADILLQTSKGKLPLFASFGPGDRPHSLSSPPSRRGGWRAD